MRSFLVITSILNGCFVGLLNSCTKLLTFILRSTPEDQSTLCNPLFYLLWVLIVSSILANIYNLNLTMRYYSQLYVMPFYESCAIFFNIISGLLLMGEYQLYTRSQLACVVVGCLVSVLGIFLKLLSIEAFDAGANAADKDDKY